MKRNLFNYDTSSSTSTDETTTSNEISSSSVTTTTTTTTTSPESESDSTASESQETISTASILTTSSLLNPQSIIYQQTRLLILKQPFYINNNYMRTMTTNKDNNSSKLNKANETFTSSSTSSSLSLSKEPFTSASVKQYKNSPFGLTGHYLTMPDSGNIVHGSAIMLNNSFENNTSDESSLEFGLNSEDEEEKEEEKERQRKSKRQHRTMNEGIQTGSGADRIINDNNNLFINNSLYYQHHNHHNNHHHHQLHRQNNRIIYSNSIKTNNNNNNKDAINTSDESCNDIDLNQANKNFNNILSSPTNSINQQHNHKSQWLINYNKQHNKHQPPHSSQPKSIVNHNNILSPAGDAGLDAKKCNAKDIELNSNADCFDLAFHPNHLKSSLSTTTIPIINLDNNNINKKKKDQHDSSSLLIRFSSIMYATFLVILGCILHVSELRQKSKNSSDHIYTTIVALIGISWLVFLQMDLQKYKRYASKYILIETIFNDHKQKQRQRRNELALLNGHLDPSARSTTSSSASLVNDRMSMNTEVIFKKTAYKMYQRRAALDYHRQLMNQNKHNYYNNNNMSKKNSTSKSSISSLNSHHNLNYHHSNLYKSSKLKSGNINGSSSGSGLSNGSGERGDRDNLIPAYKFLHGKMGANFYLKCGMAAFCFGHVIHEGLRFGQQVYFFGDGNIHCRDSAALIAHLVTPLYSFYQLFMMFKYSNLVINRHKILARFGLMHIIGTSVTFWFRTILEEAFEDFVHKMDYFKTNKPELNLAFVRTTSNNNNNTNSNIISMLASLSTNGPQSIKSESSEINDWTYPNFSENQNKTTTIAQSLLSLMSSPLSATITPQIVRHLPESYACAQNTLLTTKSMNALPYLYPFTIEYNLLLAATFLSLYFNIGKIGVHHQQNNSNGRNPFNNGQNNQIENGKCKPFFSAEYYSKMRHDKPISNSIMSSSNSNSQFESSDNSSPIGVSKESLHHHHNYYDQHHYRNKDIGEYKSNFVVNADCHSANKGLFCGFFVLLVTLVTIVIFFVTINKPTHIQLGIKINLIQEATLTALILIVTLAGFKQVVKLNRNPYIKDKVTTDDVLMLIPLPFFFIHSLLSFRAETASISSANVNGFSSILLQKTHNHDVQDSLTTSNGNLQSLVLSKNNNDNNNDNNNNNNGHNKTDLEFRTRLNNLFVNDSVNGTNGKFVQDFIGNNNNTNKNKGDSVSNNSRNNINISGNGAFSSSIGNNNNSQIDHFKLVTVALNIIVMIEVLVQTNFIIDGMRRCSESRYLRFKKPGRELITFAIILNITYWIVATFETKSIEQYKTEIEYYGPLPYMFISHTTLPVMLFYRYHSSVCLAEIWNRAYKPPKKR